MAPRAEEHWVYIEGRDRAPGRAHEATYGDSGIAIGVHVQRLATDAAQDRRYAKTVQGAAHIFGAEGREQDADVRHSLDVFPAVTDDDYRSEDGIPVGADQHFPPASGHRRDDHSIEGKAVLLERPATLL